MTGVDNTRNLVDNDSEIRGEILNRLLNDRLMAQINDDLDIVDVREKILRKENIAIGQALKLYEKLVGMKKPDAAKLEEVYNTLKKNVLYANEIRRNFGSLETLRACRSYLQRQNKGRKGSRLAESLSREIDKGRLRISSSGREGNGTSSGQESVMPIPGQIAGMYKHPVVEKIIEENRRSENKNQGVFKLQSAKFSRSNTDATNRFFFPEGYRTESGRAVRNSDSEEFIVDENGNRDLWQIPESVEQKSEGKIKALPVRLQVGRHFPRGNTESGFVHIARKHSRAIKARL